MLTKEQIRDHITQQGQKYFDRERDAVDLTSYHILQQNWHDCTVGLYLAHPKFAEMDLNGLARRLQGNGCQIAYPHVADKSKPFGFYAVTIEDGWERKLVRDAAGMRAPEPTNLVHPDIVIAPVVAFDEELNRLGHGMGGYDRAMRELRLHKPDALFVCVAYLWQEYDGVLPVEAHDVKPDAIFTREGKMTPRIQKPKAPHA